MASARFIDPMMPPTTHAMAPDARARLFKVTGHSPTPEHLRVLEGALEKLASIDSDKRFTDAARRDMRAEVVATTIQNFDAVHEKYAEDRLREVNKEEGQARAALRNDPPSLDMIASDNDRARIRIRQQHEANALKRADLDMRAIDAATELADVIDLFDEAEAVGGEVMRRVGKHAVRRADAIFAAMRQPSAGPGLDSRSPEDARAVYDMQQRFITWSKANPTPLKRLRQAQDRRGLLQLEHASARELWLRAFGFDAKT